MQIRSLTLGLTLALAIVATLTAAGCDGPGSAPTPATLPGLVPPLSDATVGEELVLKRGQTEWRYTVTEAGDTRVKVQVMKYVEGEPKEAPEHFEWHRNGFGVPADAVIRRIERGRIEAGGETWKCWILHVFTRDRGRYYYWITNEAGAHGVLKIAKVADEGVDDRNALYWAGDSASGRTPRRQR